jgi:radical SAM family protein
VKITLIHPPLDDPTIPYHATAYLAGHLIHNGFTDVAMRDLNVEFVNYCLEAGTLNAFCEAAEERLRLLGGQASLSFEEQEQYYALTVAPRPNAAEVTRAAAAFRDPKTFLDYRSYLSSVNCLTGHFGFLGALTYPAEIDGFTVKTRGRMSIYNLNDLLSHDLGQRVCYPLERYFEERLNHDAGLRTSDLLGISIIYDHQILYALHLARLFRKTWPDKLIVLGGTAISQIYKYMKDKTRMKGLFRLCDAIVVGEGETAICQMAAANGNLQGITEPMNTILYDRHADQLRLPQIEFENVSSLGRPVYQHPWELYLSPERGINYSPTRGCYWNRCTFCDYGLNTDKPTSSWRERTIQQVISDLKSVQQEQGVRYVYFAVDVMAPGYLERLSDAVLEAGLDIRWSGEIRMEKIFSPERCRKLASSGCVCVSFGMESGNQRILDLIDKGTKASYMAQTMENFSNAGVAVQLMGFTDFPSETPEEKAATYKFVSDNCDHWAAGGLAAFLLTGGSMLARNPAKFGITLVDTQDADVARSIAYRVNEETKNRVNLTEEADASFDERGAIFPSLLKRPWAGGTDTLHSMIYYSHYGRNFFKQNSLDVSAAPPERTTDQLLECSLRPTGTLTETRMDLAELFANRDRFVAYLRKRLDTPAEPTYAALRDWQEGLAPLAAQTIPLTYWLVTAREAVKLDRIVYRILLLAKQQSLTVGQILKGLKRTMADTLLTYLVELQRRGLLRFVGPDGSSGVDCVLADQRAVERPSEMASLAPMGRLK